MSEDEVFQANRPALAVRVRNHLNRYVLNHSQSLASHQSNTHGSIRISSTRLYWVHILSLCCSCLLSTKLGEILLAECTELKYAHPQSDLNLRPCRLHYGLHKGSYGWIERPSDTSQDFFCVPRPASPPVRRLVIGTHHLEYGFPSTHSANSVGMAIFFYYLVEMARPYVLAVFSDDHPLFTYWFAETHLMEGLILLYAWTIVYGRLYAGMHSALGCCIGVSVALFVIWIDPKLGDFLLNRSFYGLYPHLRTDHAVPVVILGAASVAFVGAWTGVCLGNWRTNSDYYADMAVMDAIFRWSTSWIPVSAQATCQSLWFQAISHDYLKLLANLSFGKCRMALLILGIVPIVLFKVIASSPIKKAFPAAYMAVVRHLRKSQVQLRPIPAAAESAASGHDVETKGQLRRRPNASKDTAVSPSKSNELHISTWASVDEKVCVGMYTTPADLRRRSTVADLCRYWTHWCMAINSAHRLLPCEDD
ncbi:hypothetical protein MBRA1_003386a, partial [Malassezia brasiliensis]